MKWTALLLFFLCPVFVYAESGLPRASGYQRTGIHQAGTCLSQMKALPPQCFLHEDDEDDPMILPVTQLWNLLVPPGIDPGQVYVFDILVSGGYVYVAGSFWNATYPEGVARWDGCTWSFLQGIHGSVECLAIQGGNLIAGGSFQDAGGNASADNLAYWNGNTWNPIGTGLNETVHALLVTPQGLVVGGDFYDAGGNSSADYIARWNGSSWTAFGSGLNAGVYALAQYGTSLYVGGNFIDAGGNANADRIAQWNGSSWLSLGTGMNGPVYTLAVYGSDLYAGGGFTVAGGNNDAYCIAKWSGSTWNSLGTIPTDYYTVPTLQISNAFLYASFNLYSPWEGDPQLLRYNLENGQWEEQPEGYPGWETISAIAVIDDELWVGSSGFDGGDYGWSGCLHKWSDPIPTISISGVPANICQDASPIPLPTLQSGYTGQWSGPGVTNNIFNPAGLYSYVLLTFTPDPGQCVEPISFETEVYLHETYLFVPPSVCGNSPPIPLIQYQNGLTGNWSGPGVVNNYFDPSGLLGSYTIMFTPNAGQCYSPGYATIQVQLVIIPNLFGVPASICTNNDPIALPTVQSGIAGNWSGQGVTNNSFNPFGLIGAITLTFTPNPGICATTNAIDILVNPAIPLSIEGVPDSICQMNSPIPLPTSQSGIQGNWSGPGVNNNAFNPSNQLGDVLLTFSPSSGQCAIPTPVSILVFLHIPVLSGIPDSVCEATQPITLPTLQNGIIGNWSGDGVSNNTFSPNGLQGNIGLTFTPDPDACAGSVLQWIFVNPLITPEIIGIPFSVCTFSDPIPLSPNQGGIPGQWSGPGISNDTFYPNNIIGDVLLTFTPMFTLCNTSSSVTITVQDLFSPEISGVPVSLCEDAMPISLPVIQQNITGIWSGPGVTDTLFDPAGQNDSVLLIFTPDLVTCATSTPWTIFLDTSASVDLVDIPTSVCESDGPIFLPPWQNGIVGQWIGPGGALDTFNPSGSTGLNPLTFLPNKNQCALPTSTDILVTGHVHPTLLLLPDSICESAGPILLNPVQDGIPGTWFGNGIVQDTFFALGLSGQILLSFVADNGPCRDTATTQIVVHALPETTNLQITCDSLSQTYIVSFEIVGGDPAGYTVDDVLLEGAGFTSSPIPYTQTHFSFQLDDMAGCGPLPVAGFNTCLCTTYAGTMAAGGSPLRLCLWPRFTVMYNGDAHLGSEDVLSFIMHDLPGQTLGQIFAVHEEPTFSFLPGMHPGQTYFVSAVAGARNAQGEIDLSDPCLSVSAGVPVIFYACDPKAGQDEIETEIHPIRPTPIPYKSFADAHQQEEEQVQINHQRIIYDWDIDPDIIRKEIFVFDLSGKWIGTWRDLPGQDIQSTRMYLQQMTQHVPGIYFYIMEIQMTNGNKAFVKGRYIGL